MPSLFAFGADTVATAKTGCAFANVALAGEASLAKLCFTVFAASARGLNALLIFCTTRDANWLNFCARFPFSCFILTTLLCSLFLISLAYKIIMLNAMAIVSNFI